MIFNLKKSSYIYFSINFILTRISTFYFQFTFVTLQIKFKSMKKHFFTLLLFLSLFSCGKNNDVQIAENLKAFKKKEVIFGNINKSWIFNAQPMNATAQSLTNNWTEWRIFLKELAEKPKSTIGAFQLKAKNLSKKAEDLKLHIPIKYNNVAIKSRIVVLITKVNALELFINLNQIPDAKVILLIGDINTEMQSLQSQMDEITVKSKIQKEDGESDLIKMLDTSRAIPNAPINAN